MSQLKRPFPIIAGASMFVVQFALVGFSILHKTQHRMFLIALPVAAAVLLGSAVLLWSIPTFWRWASAVFFAIVTIGTVRNFVESPGVSTRESLLVLSLVLVLAWLVYALTLGRSVQGYVRDLALTATPATRKRERLIGTTAVFIAVGCVVGYTAYLNRLMRVMLANPAIHLESSPFVAVNPGATRKINLGYSRISIPATISGDPVLLNPNGMIGIGVAPSYSLVFAAPHADNEISAILHSVSQFAHRPVETQFELRKMELAQQPFSAWQIPIMGGNHAKLGAMLLALKSMEFQMASSVRVYENGRLGVIILGSRPVDVFIEDLKSRIVQNILVNVPAQGVDALVSALLSDFEFKPMPANPALLLDSIDSAGIKPPQATDMTIRLPGSPSH
jgi:hypothetical protein